MTVHTNHRAFFDRPEALVDGCPRCGEHAETWMTSLDGKHVAWLWNAMLRVERYGEGYYPSTSDAKVGRQMYAIARFLERAGMTDPWMPMEPTNGGFRFVEMVP